MGKHKSRKDSDRGGSKRRRRSSPDSTERRRRDERLEELERLVQRLDRGSQESCRGSSVRPGDEQMIPLFDPSMDELTVEKWIEHVESLATQFDWDDRSIMRLIASRLRGHARQWYDTRQSVTATWTDTKELLSQQFSKSVPFCKLFKDAALYETRPGQSLGDYCFQKLNKLRKLDIVIPDKYLIDMVIGGIENENIAMTVRAAQHTNANTLYAYMMSMGKLPTSTEARRGSANMERFNKNRNPVASKSQAKSSNKNLNNPVLKTGNTTGGDRRTPIECFNCGTAGHMAKDCRKARVICTKCKRIGHTSEKCATTKEVNEVRFAPDNSANLFERVVIVNGHKVKGLIDTGSAGTIIRAMIIKKFNLTTTTTTAAVLKGFAGQTITTDIMTRVTIRVMEAMAVVNALVVPDKCLPHEVIVGRDFLSQEHIIVIKRGKEITFKQVSPDVENPLKNKVDVDLCETVMDGTLHFGNIDSEAKQEWRWWLEVQDFTFEIEYRAGSKMTHVDALSRNPITTLEIVNIDLTEADWLLSAQLQDEQLLHIRRILLTNQRTEETKHYFEEYILKSDKVHRRLPENKTAWVVPRNARLQICRLGHDDAGHMGAEKTLERLRRNYWFAGMRRFVAKYVKACLSCAYYKNTAIKKQGKLNVIEKTPIPFHTIHVDHVGPFETSRKHNKYLLVMVDAFTKFVIIEPVKMQKTRHTLKVLMDLINLFGCPTRIISDRGTAFTSHSFKAFCTTYAIKHVLNAVATPRANGQCERYNKTIVSSLAATAAGKDPREWDTFIKKVQSVLNTMHNKSINTTPMKALIGCDVRSPAEAPLLNEIANEVDRLNLTELREEITKHITAKQKEQKERYDKTRRDAKKYQEGDLVLVQITSEAATGSSRKLCPKFKGPFRISKVLMFRKVADSRPEGAQRCSILADKKSAAALSGGKVNLTGTKGCLAYVNEFLDDIRLEECDGTCSSE
ncbi:hypothetical protein KPH14_011876 [Odynerus spinipes]|uniref:RNA-directed DNA polymerase n=1 Tax=Odynerus spinipes TaxID=1348599 RepID=A0AAD9VLN8_9HYME|nr:hypothetical protein KPH14_011876 [Odynerus spinipes]